MKISGNNREYESFSSPTKHLIRTKDPIEPVKQGDPVYGMSRECGKVCTGETENGFRAYLGDRPQSNLKQS